MPKNMICLIISILFSHFVLRDATLGNSLMHVHVRMTYEKTNGKFMMRLSCCLKWEKKTYMLKWSIHLKLFWKEKYDLRKRFQNKQTNKQISGNRQGVSHAESVECVHLVVWQTCRTCSTIILLIQSIILLFSGVVVAVVDVHAQTFQWRPRQ